MTTETVLRLGVFFGIFLAMALWEVGAPMRRLAVSRLRRWGTNWAISILDAVMVRLLFGAAATGAALDALGGGWGVFNLLDWPGWAEFALSGSSTSSATKSPYCGDCTGCIMPTATWM
jgi:hypothetical protein